jgi:hypothetical protein
MKSGSANQQTPEAKDLVVFDLVRSRNAPIPESSWWAVISSSRRANDSFAHLCRSRSFGLPAQRGHRSYPTGQKAQPTFRRGGSL